MIHAALQHINSLPQLKAASKTIAFPSHISTTSPIVTPLTLITITMNGMLGFAPFFAWALFILDISSNVIFTLFILVML